MIDDTKFLEGMTICRLIHILYIAAECEKRPAEQRILRLIYMKAKKMNRKLYKYKYKGKLPFIPYNSWKEEDWEKELDRFVQAMIGGKK